MVVEEIARPSAAHAARRVARPRGLAEENMHWGSAFQAGECVALRVFGFAALTALVSAAIWGPMSFHPKLRNRHSAAGVFIIVGVALGMLRIASLFSPQTGTAATLPVVQVSNAPTAATVSPAKPKPAVLTAGQAPPSKTDGVATASIQ